MYSRPQAYGDLRESAIRGGFTHEDTVQDEDPSRLTLHNGAYYTEIVQVKLLVTITLHSYVAYVFTPITTKVQPQAVAGG